MANVPQATNGKVTPQNVNSVVQFANRRTDEDPIYLGNEVIQGWECADAGEIRFAIYKAFVVHDFPGGHRDGQSFGVFDEPITWSGMLYGDNAEDRAQALDFLAAKEEEIEFRWRKYWRKGVITKFEAVPANANDFTYKIEFTPLESMNHGGAAGPASPESTMQWSFQQAQESLAQPTAPLELAPYKEQIRDVSKLLAEAMKEAQGSIKQVDPTFQLAISNRIAVISASISNLITPTASSNVSFTANDVLSYLAVAQNVLNNTDEQFILYPVYDPDFVFLAAQFYQDSKLWKVIAKANGILDTRALGYFNLKIPTNPVKPNTNETVYQ